MRHLTLPRFLLATFCFFLVALLPAQNKDSLISAYREASLSRNAGKIYEVSSELGLYYMNQNEDDSAVFYYNIALKHAASQMQKADAYTGMARSTLFTQPVFALNTAKKGLTFVKDTDCVAKVNLGNAIGIYYSLNGRYDSSLYYYMIALKSAQKLKDGKLINKVNANLGDVYSYQGAFSTALKYQLESLAYAEKNKDSVNLVKMTVNVGNTYCAMYDYRKALYYYDRVYPLLKNKQSRLAGNLFNSMAVAFSGIKDSLQKNIKKLEAKTDPKDTVGRATRIKELRKTRSIYAEKEKSLLFQSYLVKKGLSDSLGIANTLSNLGTLELDEGNIEAGVRYLTECKNIAERTDNHRILRICLSELGDVYYYHKKNYATALTYFLPAFELAERDKDFDVQRVTLDRIYKCYKFLGDYASAIDYQEKMESVLDTIKGMESFKQIAEAEAKYKNSEKELQNQKLSYENKLIAADKEKSEHDKKLILIFSGASVLLLIFIFFLFYRNAQIKAKAKEEQEITKAVFESEQKERIRISRDLHDNVGTQLSLISNDIEWITHPLKALSETEKSEKMESIASASKEVINTLRETIWALNKEEVSFEEFADKLKAHVQKQVKLTKNVQPAFHENLECTIQLHPAEALGLFRICQEAIANSLKYAQTGTLSISLNASDGKYELVISDDGKGFDRQQTDKQNRYGLANMEFRAKEIGCSLQIDSSQGKGTNVKIAKI